MKISVITAVFNRQQTIGRAIQSVQEQSYDDIEHVIIDGASTDGTLKVIEKNRAENTMIISEADNGIYDAINKGIRLSSGDVIGLMHSDDVYVSESVLSKVAKVFSDPLVDAVYGDVVFFRENEPEKHVRRYSSKRFSPAMLAWGLMPAHTSLFIRKRVFDRFGLYKTDYKIAADFEFVARIFSNGKLNAVYLPEVLVRMAIGGVSTGGLKNTLRLNQEVLRACRENKIRTNMLKILSKYPWKIMEYLMP